MQEEPGLETRMAKAKSDVWNVRGRWVLGKKSRGGGTENKKGGVPRDVESRPRGTLTEHRQRRKGGTKIETIVLVLKKRHGEGGGKGSTRGVREGKVRN
jgi:hypothetical protein